MRAALLRRRGDVLGVAAVLVAAAVYLSPALKDGLHFGPYDLGQLLSVGHVVPLTIHNRLNGDLITQMIPWNTLNWRLVHAGQLPLWNGYSLLGTPQMFNFESATLSLPNLVGYAFPLGESFLAAVAGKLVIAGVGTYCYCRVLGTRPAAAAFGAITFMLSGAFVNWLGWPLSDVVAWTGFICAFATLAYRDARPRYVVLLAVSIAFCCYGGFPEAYVLVGLSVGALLAVTALSMLAARRRWSPGGIVRLVAAGAAGICLAAPLLLPGAQLLAGSVRSGLSAHDRSAPASLLSNAIAQGFYGLPLHGSVWFGRLDYYESVAYVGLAAIVLAVVGLAVGWRRPAVAGVAALGLVALVLSYHVGSFDPGRGS